MLLIQTLETKIIEQQIIEYENKKLKAQPYFIMLERLYELTIPEKIIIVNHRVEYIYPKYFYETKSKIMGVINSIFN